MKIRSIRFAAVFVASLFAPVGAWAQTITTSPFAAAAPALGTFMLIALVGVLVVAAAYSLRPSQLRAGASLAVILATALTAAIAYSAPTISNVVLSGPECFETTTNDLPDVYRPVVINDCPNPQIIDAIDGNNGTEARCDALSATAEEPAVTTDCEPGLVLQPGDKCRVVEGICG